MNFFSGNEIFLGVLLVVPIIFLGLGTLRRGGGSLRDSVGKSNVSIGLVVFVVAEAVSRLLEPLDVGVIALLVRGAIR